MPSHEPETGSAPGGPGGGLEAGLGKILEGIEAGGLLTDGDGTIWWISEALQGWWGLCPERWLGRPLEALATHPVLGPCLAPMLAADGSGESGPVYCEVAGSWFRVMRSAVSGPLAQGELLGVVDLTPEGDRLRWLEHAVRRDELTGLPNRRCFRERLGAAVNGARRHGFPLSLAYLDLDDFKQVNDRLGHMAGDAVLRDMAEMLVAHSREEDTAARLGGEEFVVLLPHTGPEDAGRKAETLREALARMRLPGPEDGNGSVLTVSVGVAGGVLPASGVAEERLAELLVATADRALYLAKAEGKNRVRRRSLRDPRSFPEG